MTTLGIENDRENWTLAYEDDGAIAFERMDFGADAHTIVICHLSHGWYAGLFEWAIGNRPAPLPIEVHDGLPAGVAREMLERLQVTSESLRPVEHTEAP